MIDERRVAVGRQQLLLSGRAGSKDQAHCCWLSSCDVPRTRKGRMLLLQSPHGECTVRSLTSATPRESQAQAGLRTRQAVLVAGCHLSLQVALGLLDAPPASSAAGQTAAVCGWSSKLMLRACPAGVRAWRGSSAGT
jgi:hypothetical protein